MRRTTPAKSVLRVRRHLFHHVSGSEETPALIDSVQVDNGGSRRYRSTACCGLTETAKTNDALRYGLCSSFFPERYERVIRCSFARVIGGSHKNMLTLKVV